MSIEIFDILIQRKPEVGIEMTEGAIVLFAIQYFSKHLRSNQAIPGRKFLGRYFVFVFVNYICNHRDSVTNQILVKFFNFCILISDP